MAGGNPNPKGSSAHKPSPSTSNRKSRWESGKNPPSDNKSGQNSHSDTKSGKNPPSDTKLSKPSSNPKDDPSSGGGPSKPSPKQQQQQQQQVPPPSAPLGSGGVAFPDPAAFGAPPQPAYGFHMLDRRSIALADGSVRSYFALPPDYQDLPPQARPPLDFPPERFLPFGRDERDLPRGGPDGFRRGGGGGPQDWNLLGGLDGRGPMPPPPEASLKRKFGDGGEERDGRDEFAWHRQQLLQYGNPNFNPNGPMAGTSSPFQPGLDDLRASKNMRIGGEYDLSSGRGMPSGGEASMKHHEVDQLALKKAFLRFAKLIHENTALKTNCLENGKQGPLQCLACGRPSKEFPDMHGLIMHAYHSHSADLHVDHLGLHKALCVLMGWNYAKVPDNSKVYQSLSPNEAEANMDDLVLWPPLVIIHNTNTGRGKDGRMEGMGNKVMDNKLKDLGFGGGKAKSLYAKEGHLGITLVKFTSDQSGLKEAVRLAEFFEKDYHGRKGWARAQASQSGRDDENNPNLVKVDERTREKQRIFYGYVATAFDIEKVDAETRKKISIESKREVK